MDLLTQLEQYVPWNEQEAEDREELLRRLRSGEDLYTRENRSAHLTASAWVVSPDRRQVLMAYHNLYNSWAWLGGHADGERDLLSAALREVREESGLRHVRPISDQIYSLEILTVDGHEKRGRYVPSHLHLNGVSRTRTAAWAGSRRRRPKRPQVSPGSGKEYTLSSTPSWRTSIERAAAP